MSNQTSRNNQKWLYFFLVTVNTFTLGMLALKIYVDRADSQRGIRYEGKTYVSALNRAQQAYFLEKKKWAKTIEESELGIKAETDNYRYNIQLDPSIKTTNIKNYRGISIQTAIAKKGELKSYLGVVYLSGTTSNAINTLSILCESSEPATNAAGSPKFDGNEMKCPDGYTVIK